MRFLFKFCRSHMLYPCFPRSTWLAPTVIPGVRGAGDASLTGCPVCAAKKAFLPESFPGKRCQQLWRLQRGETSCICSGITRGQCDWRRMSGVRQRSRQMPDYVRPSGTEFGFYSKCNGKTLWDIEKWCVALSNCKTFFSHMNVDG